MKVLIVNKFLYPNGGSETYIFEIGKQLVKMGHEVEYFGMEHEGRVVGNRLDCYTDNMDFHTGKLSKLLYPFKIIYSAEAKKKMEKVLADFCPDVVHLNNFNFQLTPSVIYAVKEYEKKSGKRVRLVYTAHDSQLVCPNHLMKRPVTGALCQDCLGGKQWNCAKNGCIHNSKVKSLLGSLEARLYQRLKTYRYLDAVICPSFFMRDVLNTSPVLADKTVTMHNFLDRTELENVSKKDYVLYFGRYSEEKGMKTLLGVCRQLPEIPFVFAGKGPLEEEVNAIKNIDNRGFLGGEALYRLIAEARFTVFPSECYENCPFTVMESQMYQTPVIASRIGGAPELVEENKSGELFEAGNAAMLKQKIETLWKDREKLDRYTQFCKGLTFMSLEEYCQKLIEIYREN